MKQAADLFCCDTSSKFSRPSWECPSALGVVYHTSCQRNQTCLGGYPWEPGLKLGRKKNSAGKPSSVPSLLIFPSNRRCATLSLWPSGHGVSHTEPEKLSTQALLHFQKSNLPRYFFGQESIGSWRMPSRLE